MNEVKELSPIEELIEIFSKATGMPWPKRWDGDTPEKWIEPMKAISEAAYGDIDMRERAIREAVKEARNRNILVSSPKSILSTALHLISQWTAASDKLQPTQAEFEAYRNKLIGMGARVLW